MFRLLQRTRVSRGTFVVSITLAAALTLVGAPASGGAATPASVNTLGVYVGYQSPGRLGSFGRAIGQRPSFAMDFLDGDSWSALLRTAPSYMAAWKGSGFTMIWGVPILPYSSSSGASSTSEDSLQQGATGAYNTYFLKLARDMVAGGRANSIVRLGWEFNAGWFPWAADGQATMFIDYWRQIVDTMRSVAGQNFTFEWNPNAGGTDDLGDYYPGNAYVDLIGLDLYDQAWGNYGSPDCNGAACQQEEFRTLLTEPNGLHWLATFAAAHGKPVALPEWGLAASSPTNLNGTHVDEELGGGDDPTFIKAMAEWINRNNVYEATFWQFNRSRISPTANPLSYAAFISDFGFPPATGNAGGGNGASAADSAATGRVQPVARVHSQTNVRVSPTVLPGKRVRVVATIRGRSTAVGTPTGSVNFAVWDRTGRAIHCRDGATARLQAATASCVFGEETSVGAPYFVRFAYEGDGNFIASSSKVRGITIRGRSVSFLR
jgi:hypothetical protein